jgi:hypothetical protein
MQPAQYFTWTHLQSAEARTPPHRFGALLMRAIYARQWAENSLARGLAAGWPLAASGNSLTVELLTTLENENCSIVQFVVVQFATSLT